MENGGVSGGLLVVVLQEVAQEHSGCLFSEREVVPLLSAVECAHAFDVNGDGEINVTDVTSMVNRILNQ